MTTKLETLTKLKNDLAARLANLVAQQKEIRERMTANPLQLAATLAPEFATLQVQIDVFKENLEQAVQKVEAEQARMNSSEMKSNVKQAEKIIADNTAVWSKIAAQLEAILPEVNAAITKGNDAAQLLKIAGRDHSPAIGGSYPDLVELGQVLGNWESARVQRGAYTANVKAAQAAKADRDEQDRIVREAAVKAKAKKPILEIFRQTG